MVYVDVTDACKSARNSGIERMTRKIFAGLAARTEVMPLCWSEIANRYHVLAARELQNLRAPFSGGAAPSEQPERHGATRWDELLRLARSRPFNLKRQLQGTDAFLITDIFRDGRMRVLSQTKRSGARMVAIFHDAAALSLPWLSQRGVKLFRDYLVSLGQFDLVICVSHESETDLHQRWKELAVPLTTTCVEGWPIEFDESLRSRDKVAQENLALCVGSLEPRKNHLALLKAADLLWESGLKFELNLVGQTGSWGRKNVVPEIDRLRSSGRAVNWLRHVNEETLHRAYRECRFTVYPSLKEGFALPILESLWHGRPCLCGRNGALGEAGAGGGCLFVDQQDATAVAAGMKQLLEDEPLYARLSADARQRTFRTWGDYIDKLQQHLRISPGRKTAPEKAK